MRFSLLAILLVFPSLAWSADSVKPRPESYWADRTVQVNGLPWGEFHQVDGRSQFVGYFRSGKFSAQGKANDSETQCSLSVDGPSYEAVTNFIHEKKSFSVSVKDLVEKDPQGFWESYQNTGLRHALSRIIDWHHRSRIYLLLNNPNDQSGVKGELICEVHTSNQHVLYWPDVTQALGGFASVNGAGHAGQAASTLPVTDAHVKPLQEPGPTATPASGRDAHPASL